MSRGNSPYHRCARCRMHQTLCLCALMPKLETRTRVVVVMHRFEDRKPTNTGHLAVQCLRNAEVVLRGDPGAPSQPLPIDPGSLPLLLFPTKTSVPLTSLARELGATSPPVTLVVPDGNWRQAAKVEKRVPGLRAIRAVHLSDVAPSQYRLRAAPRPTALSTLEAIAAALGILEGDDVRRAFDRPFRAFVERTLWARGALEPQRVTDGIPEGALRVASFATPPRVRRL